MIRKELNIGLIGLGCGGQGLVDVINQTKLPSTRISKICVKDPLKKRKVDEDLLCFDWREVVTDPSINVIVELIDDAQVAYQLVCAALRSGKSVVSANKKMIAENLAELLALQEEFNVSLLYEAACCASIPIIRNLEEYYDNDLLEGVEGIVNGSTNYILGKTIDEGLSYTDALKEAQELGYAESNPKLDVEGFDARYKLQLLILHAFGEIVPNEDILKIGISHLQDQQIRYAKEKSLQVKLVAWAQRDQEGKLAAFVLPKFVGAEDKLAQVNGVYNGLKINSSLSDEQFFVGKGAGAFPTASAVLSDISALSYGYKYEYRKHINLVESGLNDELILKVQLAYKTGLNQEWLAYFLNISERFQSDSGGYIAGNISINQLKILVEILPTTCSIVLHEVQKEFFDQLTLKEEHVFSN